jgi:hypothetical protein
MRLIAQRSPAGQTNAIAKEYRPSAAAEISAAGIQRFAFSFRGELVEYRLDGDAPL